MEEANENWWFTGPSLGRLENFPAAIIFGSEKNKNKIYHSTSVNKALALTEVQQHD